MEFRHVAASQQLNQSRTGFRPNGSHPGRADPQYSVVLLERDFLGQGCGKAPEDARESQVTSTPALMEHCADFDFIRASIRYRRGAEGDNPGNSSSSEDHGNERAI